MDMNPHSQAATRLDGTHILVVDDEFIIALDLENTLTDLGADVVVCMTLPQASAAATLPNISAAVLDINLGQNTSEAVAAQLAERGIPFIFYSGQAMPNEIRKKWPHSQLISKPAQLHHITNALSILLGLG